MEIQPQEVHNIARDYAVTVLSGLIYVLKNNPDVDPIEAAEFMAETIKNQT